MANEQHIVTLTLVVKAENQADAKRYVENNLIQPLSLWFSADHFEERPYKSGSLLFWNIQYKGPRIVHAPLSESKD